MLTASTTCLIALFSQCAFAADVLAQSSTSSTSNQSLDSSNSTCSDASVSVSPTLSALVTSSPTISAMASSPEVALGPELVISDGSEAVFAAASILVDNGTLVPFNDTAIIVKQVDINGDDEDSECSTQTQTLVMGYYTSWGDRPPESISWKCYDWIDFAFALPTVDFGLTWDDSSYAPSLLQRLVASAHANGKKVKLSIGGWTGSRGVYFSSAVSTQENRDNFAQTIRSTYSYFNLDGIDIDWEYPGHEGATGNQVSPQDSSNFLLFLQLLRTTLPLEAKISAAVQETPFVDPYGQPMKDVSAFAKVLDWVLIMNYDVWQSSPNPGPNAPLHDGCGNSTQPEANAVAAFNQWTSAGFPAAQLVLGVPSYGYLSTSNNTSLRTRVASPSRVVSDDGTNEGSISFNNMIEQSVLDRQQGYDETTFTGSDGFTRYWDDCSATPFVRSEAATQVISYDDPESLSMKACFAQKAGMLGLNMFEVDGDTEDSDLVKAIRKGILCL